MFQKIFLCVCVLSFVKGNFDYEDVSITKEDFRILMNKMEVFGETTKHLKKIVRQQADLNLKQQETIEVLKASIKYQKIINADPKSKHNTSVLKSDFKRKPHMVRRQSYDNTVVAFSATLNQQNVEHIGVHQNIVFSDVITNIGNGYNNHHGVFIAPVSGLYMFTTTILSAQNVECAAAIEINGSDVVRMFEKGADNRHGSTTQTVIVHIQKGDDVSVQNLQSDKTLWGDRYSSFSGVLLHELEPPSQIVG